MAQVNNLGRLLDNNVPKEKKNQIDTAGPIQSHGNVGANK